MVIFSELKQGPFPGCPLHIITLYFTPFLTKSTPQKAPRKLKNCIFGQISNSSLSFYPLSFPILGLSFKFYYAPYRIIIEVTLAKISFSKLLPIQSYGRNTWGVDLTPPSLPPLPPWHKKGQETKQMTSLSANVSDKLMAGSLSPIR